MRRTSRKSGRGFTLVELMIVIAIIGILASVAVPSYVHFVNRSRFTEVRMAAGVIRSALINCYQATSGSAECDTSGPTATVPHKITDNMLTRAAGASSVASVALTGGTEPQITVTAVTGGAFSGEQYVLTGTTSGVTGVDRFILDWKESGTGCDEGWC